MCSLIYLVFFTIHIPIVFRTYLWQNPLPPSLSFPAKEKEKKERRKQTEIPTRKTTNSHSPPFTPEYTVVDIYPLYPPSLIPTFMTSLRTWYIATYRDANFVSPPAWFMLYSWLELFYHAPLSIWAIGALLRDDPRVPGHLLAYAMQTAVTTATCIADFLSWEDLSGKEKVELGKLLVFFFFFFPSYLFFSFFFFFGLF